MRDISKTITPHGDMVTKPLVSRHFRISFRAKLLCYQVCVRLSHSRGNPRRRIPTISEGRLMVKLFSETPAEN